MEWVFGVGGGGSVGWYRGGVDSGGCDGGDSGVVFDGFCGGLGVVCVSVCVCVCVCVCLWWEVFNIARVFIFQMKYSNKIYRYTLMTS